MKERQVYDLASQPFSPVNIINEIAAHTGTFKNGKQLTSILIADVNGNTLTFQRDEDQFMAHIESVADHSITFENTTSLFKHKQQVPVLSVKPGQVYPNQGQWVSPFLLPSIQNFQVLCDNLDKAFVQHNGKAQMKIQEDPWDNYLYYDSRYLLPLICHAKALPIEEQLIVCLFLQQTCSDQTIS